MNAPQIPNLLSLKSARGGRSANRRGGNTFVPTTSSRNETHDRIIQQTDDDAAGSRLSAVETEHLEDDFAGAFWVGEGEDGLREKPRRMPIINRGTYVRTTALDRIVIAFINKHTAQEPPIPRGLTSSSSSRSKGASSPSTPTQSHPPSPKSTSPRRNPESTLTSSHRKVQIVSLGAGTDTRFFRLLQHHPHLAEHLVYHEIDFPATTKKKIRAIERTQGVKDLLLQGMSRASFTTGPSISISDDQTTLISPLYNIHALDLRLLAPSQNTTEGAPLNFELTPSPLPNLHSSLPTLLLSECCLTYLPLSTSTALLNHFAHTLVASSTPLETVQYEPLHPDDAFGQTMKSNLTRRGITMPSLESLPTIASHEERLLNVLSEKGDEQEQVGLGFEGLTIKQIWDGWVSVEEKERLRKCEMVDEEEEWHLLAGHYGIVRAWRD